MALEQALPRSERLDMRRIPFLTKVDLLIALSIIRSDLFPLFAETNRLRNRFAHDPNAAFTDEDVNKIRALIKSQPRKIVSPDLKWGDAKRTVAILLNIVHVNVRVGFEGVLRNHAEWFAIDGILKDRFPDIVAPKWQPRNRELFEEYERRANEYMRLFDEGKLENKR